MTPAISVLVLESPEQPKSAAGLCWVLVAPEEDSQDNAQNGPEQVVEIGLAGGVGGDKQYEYAEADQHEEGADSNEQFSDHWTCEKPLPDFRGKGPCWLACAAGASR